MLAYAHRRCLGCYRETTGDQLAIGTWQMPTSKVCMHAVERHCKACANSMTVTLLIAHQC